jgi:hypothetical protein
MFKRLILTLPLALLGLMGWVEGAMASPYRVYPSSSPGFGRGVVIPQGSYDVYRYPQGGYYQQPGNLTVITDSNVCLNCSSPRGYYRDYPYRYNRGPVYPRPHRGYPRW